jgi:muconolactone delta-isomerase
MKVLAIEKDVPGIYQSQFEPHLKAEATRVWELYKTGTIREIYFRQVRHQAVIMLECEDSDQAKQILDTLPLVREGLINFEIMPLGPYPGFERLFS